MTLWHILITDVTRMQKGHVSVAGIQQGGKSIRPVFPNSPILEEWLYSNSQVIIRPFADIELDLIRPNGQNPHSEDWVVNPDVKSFMA